MRNEVAKECLNEKGGLGEVQISQEFVGSTTSKKVGKGGIKIGRLTLRLTKGNECPEEEEVIGTWMLRVWGVYGSLNSQGNKWTFCAEVRSVVGRRTKSFDGEKISSCLRRTVYGGSSRGGLEKKKESVKA